MPFLNNNSFPNVMAQEYDDYYGYSYYSQFQTDDKKYECRTGPFEGFFVGSVEFCKHVKFGDDRKEDIRNNNVADDADEAPVGLPTCEECFNRLNNAQLDLIIYNLNVALWDVETVEEVCEYL